MSTAIYSHPDCLLHDMGDWHPECPGRLRAIEDQLILARIDGLLKTVNVDSPENGVMLENYRDDALTNGKLYLGALQPLIDRRPDEPVRDSHWLVLVQEPVGH